MPSLKWIRSSGPPQVFAVLKPVVLIGSNDACDVVLPGSGSGLVGHHAQLIFDGKGFQLEEASQEGEILINQKKKRRGKIEHGDRIQLGTCELVFSVFEEHANVPSIPASTTQYERQGEVVGLRKLIAYTQHLISLSELHPQINTLLDAVLELTQANTACVLLVHNQEKHLFLGRQLLGSERKPKEITAEDISFSDSIVQHVIQHQKPVIISDAQDDTLFGKSESVMRLKLSSVMCVPLIADTQLLGILYVGNDDIRGLFLESNLEVLTLFASHASLILQKAIALKQLKLDHEGLRLRLHYKQGYGTLLGGSPRMSQVFSQIDKVAPTDASVLILGETGTGKELVAKEIHERSTRKDGPFVAINCGAIAESLLESELFGHVKGAFTGASQTRQGHFQLAHRGTLFLDEIGELPLSLQPKLLRVLQERVVTKVGDSQPEKIDIRIIAATHRSLTDEVKQGRFREDLYYRLNVIALDLPPLRERGDDVLVLAKFFLEHERQSIEAAGRLCAITGFSPQAMDAIHSYGWPGNIRQLKHRVQKALLLSQGPLLSPEDLDLLPESMGPIKSLAQAKDDFQKRYIQEILERNQGNRSKTARDLGVDPRTIFRFLEKEGS